MCYLTLWYQVPTVRNQLEEDQKTIQILRENLTNARNRMNQQAYLRRSEREFEVGDWLFVQLQAYKQLLLKQ